MNLNLLIRTSPILSEELKAKLIMLLPLLNDEQEKELSKLLDEQDELVIQMLEEMANQAIEEQDFKTLQDINLALAPHAKYLADHPEENTQNKNG